MIVVDSSILIDLLSDRRTQQVDWLTTIDPDEILIPDLVLFEVRQGARDDNHAKRLAAILRIYPIVEVFGEEAAHETARHSRILRGLGITLRRQIDLLIGSYCILHQHEMLHRDRDFAAMARHLGLRLAIGSLPPH